MTRSEVVAAARARLPLPKIRNARNLLREVLVPCGSTLSRADGGEVAAFERVVFALQRFGCSDGHGDVVWAEWCLADDEYPVARQECPACALRHARTCMEAARSA